MSNNESQNNVADKKPYEKPQVIYQQRLEVMAALCIDPTSKVGPGTGCNNPATTFS